MVNEPDTGVLKEDISTVEDVVEDGHRTEDKRLARLDRQVVLRLDLLLLPLAAIIYLLAYLDRANIGNARVAGLAKDLGLTDLQFKTAITITYVPYILIEIPSNLLLKKVGPRVLLPFLCTSWGLVTTLQSQARSYGGLLALRFFLGLTEGGLFPGMILYLSGFYRRGELQIRIAFFFSSVSLSGAFSGLLAAAIQQLDGKGGLRGWQWIFLLEGLFTVCFGLFAFWALPNSPSHVRTFRPEHAAHCKHRLELDSNDFEHEHVTLKTAFSVFKDPHILLMLPLYFCTGSLGLGLGIFSPTIVAALGFSSTHTQLLTVPPYALGFVLTIVTAYISDRYRQRGLTALVTNLIALAGSAIVYRGRGFGVRYTGICLMVSGAYGSAPSLLAWLPNNTAGHARRATAVGTLAVLTSMGGLVATWIYPTSSAPYYAFGAKFNLSIIAISEALILILLWWLRRQNRLKDEKRDEILSGMEHISTSEQFALLGDHHPGYKYTF